MYQYPYGDTQQLNLDWLLEQWQETRDSIDNSLQAEIDRVEAAISDLLTARDQAVAAQTAAETASTAASGYASTASGAASTATAQATAAAGSAALAGTHASNALTSETNAALQATAAGNSASAAAVSATNAHNSELAAAASSSAAAGNALYAEGYAVGEQNGTPVSSGSPYYENNAKYYSDQAAQDASDAADSAQDAQDVLDSIPADYTQLSNDVTEIQTAVTQLSNDNIVITEIIEHEYVKAIDGTFTPSNPDARTGFVKIPDGVKQLVINSPEASPYNAFYSANNTSSFIRQLRYYVGETIVDVPPNAHYFALSALIANIRNITVHGVTAYEYKTIETEKMIAPVIDSMIADTALVRNDFRIVDNTLYRITAPVASGATLTPGTNCAATTIAAMLKTLLS